MVKKPHIIIQARMNSQRLPGKVMKKINGKPIIGILIERLKVANIPIILATSVNSENNDLIFYVNNSFSIKTYRGDEQNVLRRFYFAAKNNNVDTIIRLTGDNPLLDGKFIKEQLKIYNTEKSNRVYLSTGKSKTYPTGVSVEIFSFELLEEAYNNAELKGELEHVTPYIHQNKPGDVKFLKPAKKIPKNHFRLTIDTNEDFLLHKKLIEEYGCDKKSLVDIIKIMDEHPELHDINKEIKQKFWNE